jgi:predicted component of type VI protein secretion system
MAQTRTGVEEILSAETPDPSILLRDKRVLLPGETQVVVMDRADQSRFLAIVAGYADLSEVRSVRLIALPGMEKPRTNLVAMLRDPDLRAAIVKVWVTLGEDRIDAVEIKAE